MTEAEVELDGLAKDSDRHPHCLTTRVRVVCHFVLEYTHPYCFAYAVYLVISPHLPHHAMHVASNVIPLEILLVSVATSLPDGSRMSSARCSPTPVGRA